MGELNKSCLLAFLQGNVNRELQGNRHAHTHTPIRTHPHPPLLTPLSPLPRFQVGLDQWHTLGPLFSKKQITRQSDAFCKPSSSQGALLGLPLFSVCLQIGTQTNGGFPFGLSTNPKVGYPPRHTHILQSQPAILRVTHFTHFGRHPQLGQGVFCTKHLIQSRHRGTNTALAGDQRERLAEAEDVQDRAQGAAVWEAAQGSDHVLYPFCVGQVLCW